VQYDTLRELAPLRCVDLAGPARIDTRRTEPTFIAQLMAYGSASDIALAERYIPAAEFRAVLENAPAGVFTQEVWSAWHRRFGILPIPPLPRRRFPDGTLGPEAGDFFGR
jgi:hypothetical protein